MIIGFNISVKYEFLSFKLKFSEKVNCKEQDNFILQIKIVRILNLFRDNKLKSEQIGMFKCQIDFKNNVGLFFDYFILYIEISKV